MVKTSRIRSNLHDYSDTYIYVEETITIQNTAAGGAAANKKIIFKNCASFTKQVK